MTGPVESAMIFGAGFGTRMGPLTRTIPKPMVPLAGRPMIDHAIARVRAAGIERIVVNTHYLAEPLHEHLAGSGVTLLHESPEILDTGGGLKAAKAALGDGPVLTLNPDAAWTGANPVRELLDAWSDGFDALLCLVPLDRAEMRAPPGDFSLRDGRLGRRGDLVYTGAQIIRTERLDEISERAFSLNLYWDLLMRDGNVTGVLHKGRWCDIGRPEGLSHAEGMVGADV